MERFEHQTPEYGGYPSKPQRGWPDEGWFDVAGDVDDFIFYDNWDWPWEEDTTRPSRR